MQRVSFGISLSILLPLSECGEFERHQVFPSGTGLYATVALAPTADAWTLCLDNQPVERCSRSDALFYSYRGQKGGVSWVKPDVLLIEQQGGGSPKEAT